MYNVALSVAACLRAGTRVDVAWVAASDAFPFDPGIDAVALTPGGGRIGELLDGAVDAQLSDLAHRALSRGRVVDLTVTEPEALVSGLAHGGTVRCVVVPATQLPDRLWALLLERAPVCLVSTLDGDDVVTTHVHTADDVAEAGDDVAALFEAGTSTVATVGDALVTVLRAVPRLVVSGGGPVGESIGAAARLLGWQVVVEPGMQAAIGHMATLSPIDSAVILGHDVESSSRALAAALESAAGYVGSVGSRHMQQQRADWLAYRGVTDLSRVHGPAGIDIRARTPAEIAVSILAEAIRVHAPDD